MGLGLGNAQHHGRRYGSEIHPTKKLQAGIMEFLVTARVYESAREALFAANARHHFLRKACHFALEGLKLQH